MGSEGYWHCYHPMWVGLLFLENANNLISLASNGGKEVEVEPDVQEFVDGLLHMAVTDAISHWKQ